MKDFRHRLVAFLAGILLGPAVVWAGLETGTYISDLVATNPLGSDLASTLDDHIRLLKSTIKTTFPNINGAVTATDEELNAVGASGVTGSANPTASLGLSAVNGSATTFMRSDGAPALSQSIAPTWSGVHTFTKAATSGSDTAIYMSSALPRISWNETDAAADNRLWTMTANSEQFVLADENDAHSAATNVMTVDRTGTTVDRVAFPTDGASKVLIVGTPQAVSFNNHRVEISTNSANTALAVTSTGGGTMAVSNSGAGDQTYITFTTGATVRGSISFNSGGGVVAYNTTSDARLKKNFTPAPSARGVIDCIQIESFDWKETGAHVEHGVVAQRLDKCAPYAVSKGDVWQVDKSTLIPAMIKYMQEQDARIARLESDAARRH